MYICKPVICMKPSDKEYRAALKRIIQKKIHMLLNLNRRRKINLRICSQEYIQYFKQLRYDLNLKNVNNNKNNNDSDNNYSK